MRTKAEIVAKVEQDRLNILKAIGDTEISTKMIRYLTGMSDGELATQLIRLTEMGYLNKNKQQKEGDQKLFNYFSRTSKKFVKKTQSQIYLSSEKYGRSQRLEDQKKMKDNPNLKIYRLTDSMMPERKKIGTAYNGIASSFYVV